RRSVDGARCVLEGRAACQFGQPDTLCHAGRTARALAARTVHRVPGDARRRGGVVSGWASACAEPKAARVLADIKVDLPHPRHCGSLEFAELRRRVLEALGLQMCRS